MRAKVNNLMNTIIITGRAGRVRAGHCWRMFSEEYFQSTRVDEHPVPEIKRVPLEEVVLQVILLKLGTPEFFLGQCLEPPSVEQIRASIACLIEIKDVLPLAELPLTALGYHLAKMPVDVRIGKMLIYASLLEVIFSMFMFMFTYHILLFILTVF